MPRMTVNIPIKSDSMMNLVDWIWERIIIDEFEECVIEFAGLRKEEFCQGLIDNRDFRRAVGTQVAEFGWSFFDDPSDYTDSRDLVKDIRPLNELLKWLYEVIEIIDDARANGGVPDDCSAAIEALKRAGFKVVRA